MATLPVSAVAQEVAASKGVRISLLCGEVHLACVGYFKSADGMPLEQDYR